MRVADGIDRAVARSAVSSRRQRDAAQYLARWKSSRPAPDLRRRSGRSADRSSPRRCWPPTIPTLTISFIGFAIRRWCSMRCACCIKTAASAARRSEHLQDFVRFSLSLQQLDGRTLVSNPGWRVDVAPDFVRYLRTDEDLAAAHGEAIAAETRVNPDASLDISSWPRPQHDGPALRALTLMRWARVESIPARARARAGDAAALRSRLSGTALARALVRYLGGGAGPALLHALCRGGSAGGRRGLARAA